MTMFVNVGTGNWSAAATWGTVTDDSVSVPSFITSLTLAAATDYYGPVFTAPSVSDACKGGVAFYLQDIKGSEIYTLALQEFDGAIWNDAVSVSRTNDGTDVYSDSALERNNGVSDSGNDTKWLPFWFAAPYTYTTTNAGYYRFRFRCDTASGFIGRTSVANQPIIAPVDDRTGVPVQGDQAIIVGDHTSRWTVTIDDASRAVGLDTGVDEGNSSPFGHLEWAVRVEAKGILTCTNSADSKLTLYGDFRIGWDSKFLIGTSSTEHPEAYDAEFVFEDTGALYWFYADLGSILQLYGAAKSSTTLWETSYASGTGTAADPLIVSDSVDWTVDDYIWIGPGTDSSTNYNEGEFKYIKTKNSATSYVISDTVGGAEAALTYTKQANDTFILNLERNIKFNSIAGTADNDRLSFNAVGSREDAIYSTVQWVEFKNFRTVDAVNVSLSDFSYCTFTDIDNLGLRIGRPSGGTSILTFTGNIAYDGGNDKYSFFMTRCINTSLVNCYSVSSEDGSLHMDGCVGLRIERYRAIAVNDNKGTGNDIPISITDDVLNSRFINCEVQASRGYAVYLNASECGEWYDFRSGDRQECDYYGEHLDVGFVAAKARFYSPTFDVATASTIVEHATGQLAAGYKIGVTNLNGTSGEDYLFSGFGEIVKTGASLPDSTVRTSGSNAARFWARNDTTNGQVDYTHKYKQLVKVGQLALTLGFLKKNANQVGDAVTVELFLPEASAAAASYVMPDDENWNPYVLNAEYLGAVDALFEVVITINGSGASSYVYWDDILNGTNNITNLDAWDGGQPIPIMFEQLGDPQAVWAVTNANHATGGMGELLDTTHKKADDAGVLAILK